MAEAASRTEAERRLADLMKRDHTLNGAVVFGLDGFIIEVQARAIGHADGSDWRGNVTISGMAGGAVHEALDRIKGAFSKLNIPPSPAEILINLAPAELPKDGTWLDLPLAIIMLQASGYLPDLPETEESDYVLIGELGLHGEVRRVRGALSIATAAKAGQVVLVPAGNDKECSLILAAPGHDRCKIGVVSTLEEVINFFKGTHKLQNALREEIKYDSVIEKAPDLSRIKGQERAKRASTIAAAGGHNLLLVGPPGEGKSFLASALPGILPRLSREEMVVLTRIYSACGQLDRDGLAVTRRPMRSIHHSASKQSLVGGGAGIPKPGEITLAHLGVLFMDELPEFSRATIEALRQPIEAGEILISRVGASHSFPCRFTLVAAMNPCPCGWNGTDRCVCSKKDVEKYLKRVSGPILDRIDMHVELPQLTVDERFADAAEEVSKKTRVNVEDARDRQRRRFEGKEVPFNAAIPAGYVRDFCNFAPAGFEHYKAIIEQHNVSTRSMDRLAKVARTIADLSNSDQIEPTAVDEAASFVVAGPLRSEG